MSRSSISKITMNATAARVWEALTKPELVKQWQYDTNLITDWQKGNSIVYRNEWEGTVYEQNGSTLHVTLSNEEAAQEDDNDQDGEEEAQHTFKQG